MLVPQVKIITKGFREDGKYLSGEGDGEWLARVNQEYAEVYKTSNKLGLAKTQPVLTFDFVHGEYGNDRALIHYWVHEEAVLAGVPVATVGEDDEFLPEDFGIEPPF
jgi:hypothetical protein